MRVVIAASTAFHLRHLAAEFSRRGWEVEFHSYLPAWKVESYGIPKACIRSHFIRLLPTSALALLRIGGRRLVPLREALFARVDRRIAATMGECDVFIGLSSVAVASAARARAQGALVLIERGISHILTQRDIALAAGIEPPSTIYQERELASYAAADKLVLLSEFARRSFIAQGEDPARIEVVPLGVDLSRFSAPEQPPALPVRALMVGAWSLRKGSDLIGPLLARIPELTITHAGIALDLPFPESDRFRRLGHLDHVALAEQMRQHHLLIFPSRDDGFGMVMAEALASGMRVVASDASAGPDLAAIVGANFVSVVPAGDLDALADAVRAQLGAIAADPARLAAPTAAVAALSWQGYADRYEALVRRLLAERA